MRRKSWKVLGISLGVLVLACLLVFSPLGSVIGGKESEQAGSSATGKAKGTMQLVEPAFAQEGQTAGANFLEEEAGISAYTNVGQEIDLDKAKKPFKTTEKQTDEYIIGSVGLPNLPETDDVHIYVHKDGWIVAYYFKEDPIAKIIDWHNLATTKLEEGLAKMCNAAGVSFIDAKYYDFRYPDAKKLMVITDKDSYKLKIPSSFSVYERSYSIEYQYADLYIDGNDITQGGYGKLTPTQLKPDVFHTVKIDSDSIAIVLAYKEG